MVELLFGLFVLYLIYLLIVEIIIPYVIPFILTVGLVGFSFTVAGAFIYGVFQAAKTIWEIIIDRRAAQPVMGSDPARISYLMGPVWDDIKVFFENNLTQNVSVAKDGWGEMEAADNIFFVAGWFIWACLLFLGGVFFTAVAWGGATLVILISSAILTIIFALLFITDNIYLWVRGYSAVCPTCDTTTHNLHYICQSCSKRHRQLRVNKMGALYHRCECGRKMPSHILTGRGLKDQAHCSNEDCHQHIGRALVTSNPVPIAIVGGPSSGKSILMLAAANWWLNTLPQISNTSIHFEDKNQQKEIKRLLINLKQGIPPPATNAERHRAYTFVVSVPNERQETIYLYDPAGETFQNRQLIEAHRFLPSSRAIILTLDPFGIRSIVKELHKSGKWKQMQQEVGPSQLAVDDVLASLINALDRTGARRDTGGQFTMPLVVLVTKTDAMSIALDIKLATSRWANLGTDIAREKGIRYWLSSVGAEPTIRLIDSNFSQVHFFSGAPIKLGQADGSELDSIMRFISNTVLTGSKLRVNSMQIAAKPT